jgi:hypothetical protein
MIPRNAEVSEHRPPLKRIDHSPVWPKRAIVDHGISIPVIVENARIWRLIKQCAEGTNATVEAVDPAGWDAA